MKQLALPLKAPQKPWSERREYNIERYRKRRLELIFVMGGKCANCPETDPDKLEFNHLEPREWVASELSRWSRLAQYIRDWYDGKLNLLCGTCNKRAGKPGRRRTKKRKVAA